MLYIQKVGALVSSKTKSIPVFGVRLSRSESPCVLDSGVNAISRSKTTSPTDIVGVFLPGSSAMKGSGVGIEVDVGVG